MKDELIVKSKPKSTISEDIRTIRTNLEFILSDIEKSKVIMLTSSVPGEGKSFISSNLSVAFSQNEKRVLLIDCDMRLGRLHKVFDLSNKFGLSNLIIRYSPSLKFEEYIQKTDVRNLYVLTRGIVPPNPSELLSSKKFETILNKLKMIFDYIILDSVPTNGLPDALVLSKLADRVIIVSKYGSTNVEDLNNAKKSLENVEANIAGIVINKVPKSRSKYGNYYYSE